MFGSPRDYTVSELDAAKVPFMIESITASYINAMHTQRNFPALADKLFDNFIFACDTRIVLI